MIYIFLAVVSVVLLFGSVCVCSRWGEGDGICNYDYKEN